MPGHRAGCIRFGIIDGVIPEPVAGAPQGRPTWQVLLVLAVLVAAAIMMR